MQTSLFGSVPVFRPSIEEFEDFSKFISNIWPQGERIGLAKVIPPPGWRPTKRKYDDIIVQIPSPIKQVLHGRHGSFQQFHVEQPSMSSKEFERLANKIEKESRIENLSVEERERKFWKFIQFQPPLYGADMLGSLFDEEVDIWNPTKLRSLLDLIPESLAGINAPYLYFGMWKAMFGWHTEGMKKRFWL
eukprot:TRINITY_DN7229_c0_g2_i4.p1 TRINITY_DN7229_c0_g2~~TRINITY_DN7229_c0_g2_i4.p1  ORF type:complete len:190 (+),score=26.77 TRINITY_DN7229_c0_g2_i4:119-688(+)